MKNIDNIIFDLGNVILNIDYKNIIDAFEKIGLKTYHLDGNETLESIFLDIIQ